MKVEDKDKEREIEIETEIQVYKVQSEVETSGLRMTTFQASNRG